jgi:hypothetical protein
MVPRDPAHCSQHPFHKEIPATSECQKNHILKGELFPSPNQIALSQSEVIGSGGPTWVTALGSAGILRRTSQRSPIRFPAQR